MASSNIPGVQGIPPQTKIRSIPNVLLSLANQLAWSETYLANYNAISAFFWFNVPLRLIQIYTHVGHEYVTGISDYVKWIQTLALLELVHSAAGIDLSRLN